MNKRLALSFALALAVFGCLFAAQAAAPSGPPAFVTLPILTRVGEPGLEHGHFVFGGDAAIPAPLAPDRGTAAYSPAAAGGPGIGTGTDRDVSNTPDAYEGETSAVAAGSLLVGFSNHIYPGNCDADAAPNSFGDCAPLSYASSNGASWGHSAVPRVWNGTAFGIAFDPGVDVDKTGMLYYSYGVSALSSLYPNAVVMVKSTDGINFTQLTPVTFNKGGIFDDKYYLAIDRSNTSFANRIYVSWDRNVRFTQILEIAYSTDGGQSWTAPIKVNDGTSPYERVIGAYPAVDQSSGVVYDSWHDYARDIIFVDKSTNGGASWGTDVAAAVTHTGFGDDIGCVGGRSQGPAHALKVGPSGTLYLVYADAVTNRGFDVLLTRSTDGGATWSSPVTLNDDSGDADQFHPTLSVTAGHGGRDNVTVSFYDRRDDAANCEAHVYATRSTDSGATWSANVKQTSAPSNFDGNPNGPGDYSSSTPFSSAVWPFFSDHRTSNPETSRAGAFEIYTVNVEQ
jgi:hypothetical protein